MLIKLLKLTSKFVKSS